jgi:hypothetical protein
MCDYSKRNSRHSADVFLTSTKDFAFVQICAEFENKARRTYFLDCKLYQQLIGDN